MISQTQACLFAGEPEAKQAAQSKGFTTAASRTRDWRRVFATMNTSHADLINSLRKTERLTDKTAQAMLQVDRKYFLDPDNLEVLQHAYQVTVFNQLVSSCLA